MSKVINISQKDLNSIAHAVSIFGNSDYLKISEIFRTFNFYKNSINF